MTLILAIIGTCLILIGWQIYALTKINTKMFSLMTRIVISFDKELSERFDRIDHDHQQLKTRLHWSREREKKNLKRKHK